MWGKYISIGMLEDFSEYKDDQCEGKTKQGNKSKMVFLHIPWG